MSILEQKLSELEEVKAAVSAARKAVSIRVGDTEVRLHLAELERRQRELEQQIAFLQCGGGRLAVYYTR